MRAAVPNHISAWGPGVLRSGDLVAHHTISFEHLSQENIFASPGRLSSSTTQNLLLEAKELDQSAEVTRRAPGPTALDS